MKTAMARELRNKFPKVMAWVREGESVNITVRGKEVATLVPAPTPVRARKKFNVTERTKRLKEIFGDKKLPGNSVLQMRQGAKW